MKRLLFVLAATGGLFFSACDSAADKIGRNDQAGGNASISLDDVDGDALPVFSFDTESHDFGRITEGEIATYDFHFTNTGDAPLVITSARGSCGCTVPEYPRTPLAPGESGKITVSFDSNGRSGRQDKSVTLTANTVPNSKILKITSEVVPNN
ncbi:MAG: DUF1573 domain-containing protein [Flavobacteriales bacterium]|nr:MAG: DUF1573 domain-containing protein [Flavobacteriales bacterium]